MTKRDLMRVLRFLPRNTELTFGENENLEAAITFKVDNDGRTRINLTFKEKTSDESEKTP